MSNFLGKVKFNAAWLSVSLVLCILLIWLYLRQSEGFDRDSATSSNTTMFLGGRMQNAEIRHKLKQVCDK